MRKSIRRSTQATNTNRQLTETIQQRIASLLGRRNGNWTGTMTELNAAITGRSTPSFWPKSPSMLRRAVNSVVPSLRRAGIRVQFGRTTDHARRRYVSFRQN